MDMTPYQSSIDAHLTWLKQFDPTLTKMWQDRLKNEPEAAVGEAVAREVLSEQVEEIWPNEDASSGGADFGCRVGDGTFLVEHCVVRIETATKKTNRPDTPDGKVRYCRPLKPHVEAVVKSKAAQLKQNTYPVVVAISTFHFSAGYVGRREAENMLHGEVTMSAKFDSSQGQVVGEPEYVVHLNESVFFYFDPKTRRVKPSRQNISAVVMLGLGIIPTAAIGLIHPAAVRRFKPSWLPEVEFCQFEQWPPDGADAGIEWVRGDEVVGP